MSRRLNLTAWEIQDRLLHTTPTTPLFPWLPADEPLPAQARRSDGPAPCLIPLVEAVASGLRGEVLEARPRLRDRDGLWIRRRPRRRSRGERVVSLAGHIIAGLRRIDADLGLVALLEAFACRDTATDLLDAWGDLLAAWQANDRQLDEALAVPLARAADELWHWLRFRDREPVPAYNRLFELVIDVSCEERPDPAVRGSRAAAHGSGGVCGLSRDRAGGAQPSARGDDPAGGGGDVSGPAAGAGWCWRWSAGCTRCWWGRAAPASRCARPRPPTSPTASC